MSEEKSLESLINFPCEFPIKILGKDSDVFENTVSQIMSKHDQEYSEFSVKKNIAYSFSFEDTCFLQFSIIILQ